MTAKIKKTLHIEGTVIDEMRAEAKRLDRQISWLVAHAWWLARSRVASLPGED